MLDWDEATPVPGIVVPVTRDRSSLALPWAWVLQRLTLTQVSCDLCARAGRWGRWRWRGCAGRCQGASSATEAERPGSQPPPCPGRVLPHTAAHCSWPPPVWWGRFHSGENCVPLLPSALGTLVRELNLGLKAGRTLGTCPPAPEGVVLCTELSPPSSQ